MRQGGPKTLPAVSHVHHSTNLFQCNKNPAASLWLAAGFNFLALCTVPIPLRQVARETYECHTAQADSGYERPESVRDCSLHLARRMLVELVVRVVCRVLRAGVVRLAAWVAVCAPKRCYCSHGFLRGVGGVGLLVAVHPQRTLVAYLRKCLAVVYCAHQAPRGVLNYSPVSSVCVTTHCSPLTNHSYAVFTHYLPQRDACRSRPHHMANSAPDRYLYRTRHPPFGCDRCLPRRSRLVPYPGP